MMLGGALWGGGLVAIIAINRYHALYQRSYGKVVQQGETIERLRGDTHVLATWLVLARQRIAEAENIIEAYGPPAGSIVYWDGGDWKKRVKETVWEIKPSDIATRTESSVQVVPQSSGGTVKDGT